MVPTIGALLLRSLQEHAFALYAPAKGNDAGAWHPAFQGGPEVREHLGGGKRSPAGTNAAPGWRFVVVVREA